MSEFANFQFPLYNMGGVREDIVAPMPTVRVIGKWAGTPEGVALLNTVAPEIRSTVAGLRQHYYTGITPMVRKFIETPQYRMEYVMHEGKEIVTIEPRPAPTTPTPDVPSGPCRFIIVEHTHIRDVQWLYQMCPEFEILDGAITVAETDGHRLFARQEFRAGNLKDLHVGTGLGQTTVGFPPVTIPNWQALRLTPDGYLNVSPVSYDSYGLTKDDWPPAWRWWRSRPGVVTLLTPASQALAVPSMSNRPPSYDDGLGAYSAQEVDNLVTVLDIKKLLEVNGEIVDLQLSAFWQTLIVDWGAPVAFYEAATEFRYNWTSGFVGVPSPQALNTSITRLWMSGDSSYTALGDDLDRLVMFLNDGDFFGDSDTVQPSEQLRKNLGITISTKAVAQTVSGHQSERVKPYSDGSVPDSRVGSPPVPEPWGDNIGRLVYNCRTGEFGFSAPNAQPVDLSGT